MEKDKKSKKIDFEILHLDPMGQGVSRAGDTVCFIPKTLPNETGTAIIQNRSKGVVFAWPEGLKKRSELREDSPCPHYDQCTGCHYLHTSYPHELQFKAQSFSRKLSRLKKNISVPIFSIHSASKRFLYRNRVQLHYDLKKNLMGLINRRGEITEVPSCLLPQRALQEKIQELYLNRHWQSLLPKNAPPKGHLEVYFYQGKVEIAFNAPYAFMGFTQVNLEENLKLKKVISTAYDKYLVSTSNCAIDLFGGNGNLSEDFQEDTIVVDSFTPKSPLRPHQTFLRSNIFEPRELEKIIQLTKGKKVGTMIVDPPRSGIKLLPELAQGLGPKILFYVSCNDDTLIRDLELLRAHGHQFQILESHLFDFFPGSWHYENLVILKFLNF